VTTTGDSAAVLATSATIDLGYFIEDANSNTSDEFRRPISVRQLLDRDGVQQPELAEHVLPRERPAAAVANSDSAGNAAPLYAFFQNVSAKDDSLLGDDLRTRSLNNWLQDIKRKSFDVWPLPWVNVQMFCEQRRLLDLNESVTCESLYGGCLIAC
jgi:hypothetical protein